MSKSFPPLGRPDEAMNVPVMFLRADSLPLSVLSPLFQRGFWVWCGLGGTLQELLCGQLGVSSQYVVDNITTLFLDGQPVDHLEVLIGKPGTSIALSAAMPGLLGAVMRRGGYYAALRDSITYRDGEKPETGHPQEGFVQVKLFNKVMVDLGAHFLARGVLAETTFICELLRARRDEVADSAVRVARGTEQLDWPDFCQRGEEPWTMLRLQ